MTPAARVQAAIEIIDLIIAAARDGGPAADTLIAGYFRTRRYAGSKDRRAVRDLVYDAIRRTGERPESGRAAMLGLAAGNAELGDLFEGQDAHGPGPVAEGEAAAEASIVPIWINGLLIDLVDGSEKKALLGRASLDIRINRLKWKGNVDLPEGAAPSGSPDALSLPEGVAPSGSPDVLGLPEGAGPSGSPDTLGLPGGATRPGSPDAPRLSGGATLHGPPDALGLPEGVAVPGFPDAMRLPEGFAVEASAAWREGLVEVQDAGSQAIAAACAARPGMTVIDLCAGAGGKTLALAAAMEGKGRLIAADTIRTRLSRLPPRAERAGAAFVETLLLDQGREGEKLDPLAGTADVVLVDAPCSGTGTWRRNPEARWRLTPARLARLVEEQARILDMAAPLLAPGGRLVYAVCALTDAEGPAQIAAFIDRHPGWSVQPLVTPPGRPWGRNGALGVVLTPAHDGTDGFFFAAAQKL
jgi:16S rRNA (cytosine967-C5)-methyltransferase